MDETKQRQWKCLNCSKLFDAPDLSQQTSTHVKAIDCWCSDCIQELNNRRADRDRHEVDK